MYCGTPVEAAAAEAPVEADTAAPEGSPQTEPLRQTRAPRPTEIPEEVFFEEPAREQLPEEPPIQRQRPVFDDIQWNVSEYPDSESVTKTDDIDFNWNARPEDIPDPVIIREQQAEERRQAEGPLFGFVPQRETETAAKEPGYEQANAPADYDLSGVIEPVSDVDARLDSVIRGEDPGKAAAADVTGAGEELSAAERIDKFYTFNRKNEEFQQLLNREYEKVKSGNAIGAELSRADAIAEELFKDREEKSPESMEEFFEAEGIVKPYQPKAFESDVLQRIEAQEAEREAKRIEEEARKAAIEKARQEAEEARIRAEKESEEARIRAEAEARKAAEEARAKAEAEARESERLAEEARIRAEKEAQARAEETAKREAAEAKVRAEEEARLVAEEEARIKAEAVARYQAQEEARIRAEEELKAAQEAARIRAQQEARLAAEEQAKYEAAREARRLEEEEAKRKLEEEQDRLAREANENIAAEEARKVLEQTARMRDEEAAKIKAAVASLRAAASGAVPVNKEVEEAHKATQNQISEMAKARSTFFGQIDIAKEMEKDVSAQGTQEARAEAEGSGDGGRSPAQSGPAKPAVTGRSTMLHGDLSDTKVFDKKAILAGITDSTITANRSDFARHGGGRPIDYKEPEGTESIDDLLEQLETVKAEPLEEAPTQAEVPAAEEVPDAAAEDAAAAVSGSEAAAYETEAYDADGITDVEELPTEEEPDAADRIMDFSDLDEIGPAETQVEEPTIVFDALDQEQPAPEDLGQTRRFDHEELEQAVKEAELLTSPEEAPLQEAAPLQETTDAPLNAKTEDTLIIGQMPEEVEGTGEFDTYGTEEAQLPAAEADAEAAFNTVVPDAEEETGEAVEAAAPMTRKEKKAAAKAEKLAAKQAAREAKAAAKAARKGAAGAAGAAEDAAAEAGKELRAAAESTGEELRSAAGEITEAVEEPFEEEPEKGGKGRAVLIVLLIILCIVLAAEVVGIGVHYVAPQSRVAEFVDNQLNKVIHMITGDDTDYSVSVIGEERREGPAEDYAAVVADQSDRNYNALIASVTYNADLKYEDEDVADNSDLVLTTPITDYEWGRTEDNMSVYYDEEVIGQTIAYESQKYALMKDGDESVLTMVTKDSMKGTLLKKKNSDPGDFTELEIGEVRVSGNSYYCWIKEHIGDKTTKRVIKMHPESQFIMMVDRGYDI